MVAFPLLCEILDKMRHSFLFLFAAKGVIVNCRQNEMSITIPKSILKGMDREHVRLLDPRCGATETPTHFVLKTPLTECNTTRRYTRSAIVYSNKVLEIPLKKSGIITRVREIEIPFSCYYSIYGEATAVGVKPENRKLVFSEKGKGSFTVVLELFHGKRWNIAIQIVQKNNGRKCNRTVQL